MTKREYKKLKKLMDKTIELAYKLSAADKPLKYGLFKDKLYSAQWILEHYSYWFIDKEAIDES